MIVRLFDSCRLMYRLLNECIPISYTKAVRNVMKCNDIKLSLF